MVKYLPSLALLAIAICRSAALFAQEASAESVPDPQAWAAELSDKLWLEVPGIVRTFTIIPANQKSSTRWSSLSDSFADKGFLQYIPIEASAFASRLNMGEGTKLDAPVPLESSAAHLILQGEKDRLAAHGRIKGEMKLLGKWGYKKADIAEGEAFYKWLIGKLAYDAIILDVRDNLILAGLLNKKTGLGQGLSIKNSAQLLVLNPAKTKGDALLQMLRVEGDYAVFESILANPSTKFTPGTKILLGQNDKFKHMMGKEDGSKPYPSKKAKDKDKAVDQSLPAAPSGDPSPPAAEALPAPSGE